MYSRVVLDHPRGFSRQLHKCIAARASSQIVFNGNIKVNRSIFSHTFIRILLIPKENIQILCRTKNLFLCNYFAD